ncbi:Sensor histidine kinase RcsC [Paenibacillus plantiphilus]|uniref:histidine kinase n=1 Tax=Paenibacillus plantiphilus TaxID=2905650 RepID=A0ABN8GKN6_9BACL|nr:sensor histidine kinase [Paenibacillus plantiphilus]CAH1209604.1 Sensor histidine kinase RcsC [Paenibacillus plantiphilus]
MRWFPNDAMKRSIFVKFVFSFVLVGFMPLIVLGYFLMDAYFTQSERFNINNLEQMSLYIAKNSSQILTDYNDISKMMYDVNWYDRLSQAARGNRNHSIDNWLVFALSSDPYIENAYFIPQSSMEIIHRSRRAKQFVPGQFPYADLTSELERNPKGLYLYPAHQETYFVNSNRLVMTFSRNLIDKSTLLNEHPTVLGTFIYDVSVDNFNAISSELHLSPNDEIMILSDDHIVNYSNNEQRIGTSVSLEEERSAAEKDNRHLIAMDIAGTDQKLVGSYARTGFLATIEPFKFLVIVVASVCMLFLLLLAIVFSRRFSRPIREIIKQMRKMESGDFNVALPVKSQDELGLLNRGMNRLADQLNRFIEEAYAAELRQKQSELNALKSQIRPHYLYNTLEVIRMSAVSQGAMPVADMIHVLSNQLQYVLDYGESMVTLEEEVANVRNYFDLIQVRFEERVGLQIHIGSEVSMKWGVPKLSIQPLVENAVLHGILKKREGGQIRLQIEAEDGNLLSIWIIDDGVGMDEQQLGSLRERLEQGQGAARRNGKQTGIGLKNVHDRIQSLFGGDGGIHLESTPSRGTTIQIRIPIVREIDRYAKRISG